MTFDKPEHQKLVLEMLNQVSVPGQIIETVYELKQAVISASVVEQAEPQTSAVPPSE